MTTILSSQRLVEARCPSCGSTMMVTEGYDQNGDFTREQGICPSTAHRKPKHMKPYGSVHVKVAHTLRNTD